MKHKYSWSRQFDADAQQVGEWLYSLPEQTDEAVVAAAKSRKSPAHKIIWGATSSEAEREYRLLQARILRNSIRVEIVDVRGKPEYIQAFIRTADNVSFVPTVEATDDDLTGAEARCLAQMRAFKARWQGIRIAKTVVEAIRETEKRASRKRKAA